MSCPITYGYSLPCKSTAGVQAVYISTYSTGLTYTIDSSASGATSSYGTITGFGGTVGTFYHFQLPNQVISFTQDGASSDENGTTFVTQTLELTLYSLTQPIVELINILARGNWRIILLDQNGNYWLMNKQNPVTVTTYTPGLGKAFGDLNGAVITFQGMEPYAANQVSSAAFAALTVV